MNCEEHSDMLRDIVSLKSDIKRLTRLVEIIIVVLMGGNLIGLL